MKVTMKMKHSLSRRTVLRGAAVSIGLPVLEAMLDGNGTALASGEPIPVRLVTYLWAHGVNVSTWAPRTTGAGSEWTLSADLAPFAPVKEYVSILSGTNNP